MSGPLNYDEVKALAERLHRPASTLIALAPGNDPFYAGARRQELAEWFATEVWPLIDVDDDGAVHIRRVHYVLISLEEGPQKPDGTAYENTFEDWQLLIGASRDARELNLVDAGNFVDRRAGEPIVYIPDDESYDAGIEVTGGEIEEYSERVPTFVYTPHDYEFPELPHYTVLPPEIGEPYAIEIWVEKSTMADVLEPVARDLGVTLITGVGELSLTRTHELVERVRSHGRKTRVLYLSDFDPAGNDMPVSIARKLEFILRRDNHYDLDIRLDPLLLTREQVEHYRLPRIPIKDSDKRKAAFEDRFGEGAVELDALEALHPGELGRLVTERIGLYREPTEWAREDIDSAVAEFEQYADNVCEEVAESYEELLTDLRERFDAMQAAIAPHRDALIAIADEFAERYAGQIEQHIAAINARVSAFYGQASEVWSDIKGDLESHSPDPDSVDWPEPDEADESDEQLFQSERDYVAQMEFYKAHQGKPTERRRKNGSAS